MSCRSIIKKCLYKGAINQKEYDKLMRKMDEVDNIRDCENCVHHTEQGCTKWECEFERVSVKPLERQEIKMTDEVIPGGDPWKNWSDSLIRERRAE